MAYGTVEIVISVKDRASAILRRLARMIRRPKPLPMPDKPAHPLDRMRRP